MTTMATATLAQNRAIMNDATNEFGHMEASSNAFSRPNGATRAFVDRDEDDMMPTLKKQLEADRQNLSQRMQQAGESGNGISGSSKNISSTFSKATSSSQRPVKLKQQRSLQQVSSSSPPQARPVPRRDRHNEILQDGLGNDELIPSEWATGSRARFDGSQRNRTTSSNRQQPSASENWSTTGTSAGRPGSNVLHQTVVNGQDPKTQRSPRDNSKMGQVDTDTTDRSASENSGPRQADSNRQRTLSSPGLSNFRDESSSKSTTSRIPIAASRNTSSHVRNTSGSPQSSMAKRTDNRPSNVTSPVKSPRSENRKGPGGGGAASRTSPTSPSAGVRSTSSSATAQTRSPLKYGALQQGGGRAPGGGRRASTTTPDQLDEFGPLGGTPRLLDRDRTISGTSPDLSRHDYLPPDEFGNISRTSSTNPWDEELIPTVKRRLAQQMMLEGGAEIDGLIDTWDRHGLPLTTRAVSQSSRQNLDDIVGGTDLAQGQEGAELSHSAEAGAEKRQPTAESTSVEQQERLRRLNAQLDMSLQQVEQHGSQQKRPYVGGGEREKATKPFDNAAAQAHLEPSASQSEWITMEAQRGSAFEHSNDSANKNHAAAGGAASTGTPAGIAVKSRNGTAASKVAGRNGSATKSTRRSGDAEKNKVQTERPGDENHDGAGCCKCTIM